MMARNRIASFAMVAVMVAVLTARTMRAQQKPNQDTAGNTAVTQADERIDPNMPGPISPPGLKVRWTNPVPGYYEVVLADPNGPRSSHAVEYLGWNDQGSYLHSLDDGQIYIWNLQKNSLTKFGREIPPAVLATLKNNPVNNRLAAAKKAIPAATQADERNDPNLPGMTSPTGGVNTPSGVHIEWVKTDPAQPLVGFSAPGVRTEHNAQYLGWNDKGSYFRNLDDRQVYVWNLSKGTLTKIGLEVPPAEFASLKNNSYKNSLAAAKNAPPPPKAVAPEPKTPDTSRQAAFFGGSGNLTQAAVPGAVTGSGATIQNGVLTFTRADNTKASYKVVRPKVAQGSPGSTGTWIAMEDAGKGILFTVQGDGTLTGREMPAQLIQMLTHGAVQH